MRLDANKSKFNKVEEGIMQRLAIIGGGRMAGIFAKNAYEMGIETHCFSLESGVVEGELFDYIHYVNILDRERVADICESIHINGVVATTELTIAIAAYVADKLNLIGIPMNVSEVITNKYRNRSATEKVEGLYHPRFSEVNSIQDVFDLEFNYPIILKPTSKGGKRGIIVIRSQEEVHSAFEYVAKDSDSTPPFIAEEYIEGGVECSVESLSYNNKNYIIQITEKITSGEPHCVELAHHQPANLSDVDRSAVENVVDKALLAIGIKNGPCHTEVKVKDGKVYLIEFNARPGGDHVAYPLTELSTGYSYIKGAIEIALNEFKCIDKSKLKKRYAGVMFVTRQTPELKFIFEKCENYEWCYKKNVVSTELKPIIHNDGFNMNYFIYLCDERPNFLL